MLPRLICFLVAAAVTVPGAIAPSTVVVPAGTDLQIRLTSKVASDQSKPKDTVEAVIIAPVIVNGQLAIPAGTRIRGRVEQTKRAVTANERAVLQLGFSEIVAPGGKTAKMKTRIVDVDNARESVDDKGKVVGILAAETISARINQGIAKVAQRNPALADILDIAKGSVLGDANPEIDYEPGTELTITTLEPMKWEHAGPVPSMPPIGDESALLTLANSFPYRTYSVRPERPSDITNLMFIGSQQAIENAFKSAGWSTAHSLSNQSVLETIRAIAELRGYKEAPVSILTLEHRPPDLVFQKQNNTFAQRHHLRIWRMSSRFEGQPVWVASSTHDIGIDFSEENHTFIHKIDPQIDKERAKIVSDLMFTNQVQSLALVDRPQVPTNTMNATGDQIITDAKMAVVLFKPAPVETQRATGSIFQ
jgi:hypothetical protein